jgi:hypothetical protein
MLGLTPKNNGCPRRRLTASGMSSGACPVGIKFNSAVIRRRPKIHLLDWKEAVDTAQQLIWPHPSHCDNLADVRNRVAARKERIRSNTRCRQQWSRRDMRARR